MRRFDISSSPHVVASKLKRRKELLNKFLFFFGLLLLVFVSLGVFSRLEKININNIKVEGNRVTETRAVQDVIEEEISGHYFWLFPKSNVLFYSKKSIENKLREEFKIFNEITLNLQADRSLLVSVTEHAPAYTWCGTELPKGEDKIKAGDCYFMDNNGYVFAVAPYFSGDVYFRFFGPLVGEETAGATFMPDIFPRVDSFIQTVKSMGLEPVAMQDYGEKLEIYLSGGEPPSAPKITLKRDFEYEKMAENLQAAITTEPLKSELAKRYASLLYIDLSFGNKVYYKFK